MKIRFVSTKAQIADLLTKHFTQPEVWLPLLKRAGIRPPGESSDRARHSSPSSRKRPAMFVRLKPSSKNRTRSVVRAAHTVRPATPADMSGDIGGEREAQALMSDDTRALRAKVWWAFAHDSWQLLRNVVPRAVGHVRDRTQATMDRWFRFMHQSGCRPFISVLPLGESAHVDEAVEVAKTWPALLENDSAA